MENFGFKQSNYDHRLFTLNKAGIFLVLIIYVDDILLIGNNRDEITAVEQFFHTEFTIKDLGEADHFLRIQLM